MQSHLHPAGGGYTEVVLYCGRECAHDLDRCSAGKWPTSRCRRKSRWGEGRRLARVEALEDSGEEVVGECRRCFRLLELLVVPWNTFAVRAVLVLVRLRAQLQRRLTRWLRGSGAMARFLGEASRTAS